MNRLGRTILGIPPDEVRFVRRGFRGGDEPPHLHLEVAGAAFVEGYTQALESDGVEGLALRLNAIELEFRGFGYEGAAMALRLRDFFRPQREALLPGYLRGPASLHSYLAHVGIGWALGRLPITLRSELQRYEPKLRWLVVDGYAFHCAFFKPRRWVDRGREPGLRGYFRHAFDQGLGRSLWFVEGAGPDRIAASIERLAENRHGDLWAGVGLACAYAGGLGEEGVARLAALSGPNRADLLQGAAFAAEARSRASNIGPATELACGVFWRRSAEQVAAMTRRAGTDLPQEPDTPIYEVWRQRLRALAEVSTDRAVPWAQKAS